MPVYIHNYVIHYNYVGNWIYVTSGWHTFAPMSIFFGTFLIPMAGCILLYKHLAPRQSLGLKDAATSRDDLVANGDLSAPLDEYNDREATPFSAAFMY